MLPTLASRAYRVPSEEATLDCPLPPNRHMPHTVSMVESREPRWSHTCTCRCDGDVGWRTCGFLPRRRHQTQSARPATATMASTTPSSMNTSTSAAVAPEGRGQGQVTVGRDRDRDMSEHGVRTGQDKAGYNEWLLQVRSGHTLHLN